jgi:hypothetical protein
MLPHERAENPAISAHQIGPKHTTQTVAHRSRQRLQQLLELPDDHRLCRIPRDHGASSGDRRRAHLPLFVVVAVAVRVVKQRVRAHIECEHLRRRPPHGGPRPTNSSSSCRRAGALSWRLGGRRLAIRAEE